MGFVLFAANAELYFCADLGQLGRGLSGTQRTTAWLAQGGATAVHDGQLSLPYRVLESIFAVATELESCYYSRPLVGKRVLGTISTPGKSR